MTLDGSSGEIEASQEIDDPSTYTESMWFQTTTDCRRLPDVVRSPKGYEGHGFVTTTRSG